MKGCQFLENPLRQAAESIARCAVEAVRPGPAVATAASHLALNGPLRVVGVGKAAAAMALEIERLYGAQVQGGVVVVKDGHSAPLQWLRVMEAAHPVPDARSLEAGYILQQAVAEVGDEDTLVFVLSGGASSLAEVLPDGLSLSDLQTLTRTLLQSGPP